MAKRKNELIGGLLLVAFGFLALAGKFIDLENLPLDLGLLFLPALGALFILLGIVNRNDGLLVPGGILSGIGWGSWLIVGPLSLGSGAQEGGIFLMVFGLGFISITVLSTVFTNETHWWAVIPGGILFALGLAILVGGVLLTILAAFGRLWPLALIFVGLYIIFRHGFRATDKSKSA